MYSTVTDCAVCIRYNIQTWLHMMRKINERTQCTKQADVPRSVSSVIGVLRMLNIKLFWPAELTQAVSNQWIKICVGKSCLPYTASTLICFFIGCHNCFHRLMHYALMIMLTQVDKREKCAVLAMRLNTHNKKSKSNYRQHGKFKPASGGNDMICSGNMWCCQQPRECEERISSSGR